MINVVLVGAGMVSIKHIQAWLVQQDAEVVYVVDHNLEKAKAAAQSLGINEYGTDYSEIISSDDVDAVDICVTANEHVDVATFAANSVSFFEFIIAIFVFILFLIFLPNSLSGAFMPIF